MLIPGMNRATYSYLETIYPSNSTYWHFFGMWEESWEPREKWQGHGDSMQKSRRVVGTLELWGGQYYPLHHCYPDLNNYLQKYFKLTSNKFVRFISEYFIVDYIDYHLRPQMKTTALKHLVHMLGDLAAKLHFLSNLHWQDKEGGMRVDATVTRPVSEQWWNVIIHGHLSQPCRIMFLYCLALPQENQWHIRIWANADYADDWWWNLSLKALLVL